MKPEDNRNNIKDQELERLLKTLPNLRAPESVVEATLQKIAQDPSASAISITQQHSSYASWPKSLQLSFSLFISILLLAAYYLSTEAFSLWNMLTQSHFSPFSQLLTPIETSVSILWQAVTPFLSFPTEGPCLWCIAIGCFFICCYLTTLGTGTLLYRFISTERQP